MHIVFHLGLHCTDDGLLIRSILQNRARLAEYGTAVPGPIRYRELFGEVSTSLRGAPATAQTESEMLFAIAPDPGTERVILSSDNFLCRSNMALARDRLYPKAGKSAWLRQCLPSHTVEFALAVRNPASLIPDLISGAGGPPPPEDLLADGIWLEDLKWSDVVRRIAEANPGARIVVWCHEDTPFIWPQILHELTGVDPCHPLDGALDMAETIMTPAGYTRLSEFLQARDVGTETRRRRAIAAFLEAHAIRDQIEAEIDLPGWTEATIDALTEIYELDLEEINRMPGVTLLDP